MVEYSAGIVTAYGSAKRAGYTGTYEDFCRQQAQYADNALAVEQAKQTAVSASQSAVSASTTAQTASTTAVSASNTASTQAQLAVQSAQDAQTAESNAQTYAQSASQSAGSAQQSAQSAQSVLESIPEDYSDLSANVSQLKADLEELETHVDDALFIKSNVSDFEAGVINVTYGSLGDSSKRVRGKDFINVKDFVSIILATDNLKVSLRYYDEAQDYISGDNYFTAESIYDLTTHRQYPENTSFIKIVAAYNDDSTITDVSAFNSLVETNVNVSKFDILDNNTVDITKSLNNEGYINLGYKHGNVNNSSGVDEWNNLARAFSHVYIPVDEIVRIVANNNAQYSLRYYDENKQYLSGMSSWSTSETFSIPNNCKYVRVCGRYSSDAEITNLLQFADDLMVYCKSFRLNDIENKFPFASNNKMFAKSVGNASIVCAKELTNDDGNCPVIEWYLLEEAGGTNRFYVSRDLHEKQFAFMFTGDAYKYSFGILANGDIIAVLDASSINWDDAGDVQRSETFRKNPYVFLASENWSVQHEVDFGDNLKPLGWLSNYGFRTLPDGSAVFAEYTRYCVLTANVWRINGDPTDYTNWNTVISLSLLDPGQNLLKHWHTVQYDPYSNIVYAATGDSNSGSFCYYSSNYGVTWSQLLINGVDHSSKYFRFLNLIFTEDTIYWAKDWYDAEHYLFKCGRDSNGIMDITNVIDYIQIPQVENLSTYTTCYMPEIDAILLLEREDSGGGTNVPAPIRLCDLENGTLHTIAYMRSAKGVREQIGFRTRYSEVYPQGGMVNIGWQLRRQLNANGVNLLDWYDNAGNDNTPYMYGLTNVNNLWLKVYKNSTGYHLKVGTRLI